MPASRSALPAGARAWSQIIGEACRGLSEDFRQRHREDIWSSAVSFRNVLVHQYFGIDVEAVWQVVSRDLPALHDLVYRSLALER